MTHWQPWTISWPASCKKERQMLIRFDELEPSVVSHMKGGEGEARLQLVQDVDNKIMRSVLAPGASIGLHTHETSSEVMYFLSGTGKVLYDGVWEPVAPGTCHYCPKGHSHSLVNDGTEDLVTFAVVPEHEKR